MLILQIGKLNKSNNNMIKNKNMFNLFSEKQGIKKNIEINPKEVTSELKNRLWNKISEYLNDFRDEQGNDNDKFIVYLWDRFFKKNIDSLFHDYYGYGLDEIKEEFFNLEWYSVYDFLECLLGIENYQKEIFVNILNGVLKDERAPYKIIDNQVVPLISNEEAQEVEDAVSNKYKEVSGHIKKSLGLYKKRPVADYKNSIKESISAVEALAKIVLKKPNGTLGGLAQQLNVHPAFKKAITDLYGWTSNEGGIRHSEKGGELKIDEAEAKFMLVMCSSFVNYIISKYK